MVASGGDKPWAKVADRLWITGNTYVLQSKTGDGIFVLDPWGQRLRYTIHNTTIISTGSGGGFSSTYPAGNFVAMTLTSLGPDRTLGTGDDTSLQITMAELRGSMAGLLP